MTAPQIASKRAGTLLPIPDSFLLQIVVAKTRAVVAVSH